VHLARLDGAERIQGIVVENAESLPGKARELRRVRTTSRTMSLSENIENYQEENARWIEATSRGDEPT